MKNNKIKCVRKIKKVRNKRTFSYETPFFKTLASDGDFDLVYIVKEGDDNPDLRMSLRSVAKFCNFRDIWIVGYKPEWVKNVKHISVEQANTKWQNSFLNQKAACECEEISENFILMNDDFFAIRQILDWKESLNYCLGDLNRANAYYKTLDKRSKWQKGFEQMLGLLESLNCSFTHNFEVHIPMIINKFEWLDLMLREDIQAYYKNTDVVLKRSLYKNMQLNNAIEDGTLLKTMRDVKLFLKQDNLEQFLGGSWISVFDDVVGNRRQFPKINKLLTTLFPIKCRFEK